MQVGATVGHAKNSGDLRKFIQDGKKIIVSTVQKFPFVLDEIVTEGSHSFPWSCNVARTRLDHF
jgi:type I restriction enzyme R subunit